MGVESSVRDKARKLRSTLEKKLLDIHPINDQLMKLGSEDIVQILKHENVPIPNSYLKSSRLPKLRELMLKHFKKVHPSMPQTKMQDIMEQLSLTTEKVVHDNQRTLLDEIHDESDFSVSGYVSKMHRSELLDTLSALNVSIASEKTRRPRLISLLTKEA